MTETHDTVEPIAIIGMACRVPGADTVDQFWRNMRDGVESITRFTPEELIASGVDPATVAEPDYVPAAGVVDGADGFDAAFFGYNAREAETMDPQHRLLCEVAWAALEDSGHDPARAQASIGVFAGTFMNKYMLYNLQTNTRFQRSPMAPLARIFNDKDFLASRLAYLFDLDGPAYTVQTACSTSLVATHLACQSLLGYECDLTLVGGVAVNVPLRHGYPVAAGGLFSADGHCRPFDARADGTVPGNGAVMLVLRRLSDALADRDHVYAVIRGTAVNNDGAVKAGFTAPSVDGQAKVINAAQAMAGVDPATIGYLEAHGTATQVGDPIEVAALTQAFRAGTSERGFCALGSVKANIGHLDAAAGAAGLMRAALALANREIPASLNFRSPNPELKLSSSPFYVPIAASEWKRGAAPRRAGVSSFGVGGTNAHVVLEEPPPVAQPRPAKPWQLVTISARSRAAVDAATARLADHLTAHPELTAADVAFTLQSRRHFPVRRFVACTDTDDLASVLRGAQAHRLVTRSAPEGDPQVVFMFPGGGTQHREMGADIYRAEPVFRAEVDRCAEILAPSLGLDLRHLIFPSLAGASPGPGRARRAGLGRGEGPGVISSLFVIEYALAKLWLSWGVRPAAMIGHSLGEYVAACLAGVFSLEDALALTHARGELFAQLPPGRMVAIQAAEPDVLPYLHDRLSVSAVNAPSLTVVAGADDDIEELLERLRGDGVECSRIGVPVASHSFMVEPFLDEFAAKVKGYRLSPPQIPFISCVTGDWVRPHEAADPGYWVRHLRQPVRFADGIRQALAKPGRVLLEVGPGRALSALAAAQRMAPAPVAISSMGHPRDRLPGLSHLMTAVGRLWQAGVDIDWTALHGESEPRRVSLPTYPFERTRYWIAAGGLTLGPEQPVEVVEPTTGHPADDGYTAPRTERERELAVIWCDLLGVDRIGVHDDLFDAGAHSLMITQVTKELHRRGVTHVSARDVLQAPTIAALAALVDGEHGAAVEPDLADDVVLDPEITAAGAAPCHPGPPRTVLLTGATGFVGSFLAAELGAATSAEVLCLVRAADAEEGLERLRGSLDSYGLTLPSRVEAIPGDLSKPLLGLSPGEFDRLAERVDAIYHCGAWVNFVRPYRALKAANVGGTQEVLRLATRHRLKPVHHISTMAVLAGAIAAGAAELHEDDPLPPPIGHDTAYSQSKWVAEGLVGLARERGVPVSVYRAGAVLCDSRTGAANREDYVTKIIQGCVELGLAPLRDYPLAVAPVDHVARLVVGLSLRPDLVGRTFHTIDPAPLAWNDIFAAVRRFGYPVRSVPFDTWRRELTEQVELEDSANALAPLMAMLGDTGDRPMPRMDCRNVVAGLPDAAPPALDDAFFDRMLSFFVRGGWLPPATTEGSSSE